MKTKVCTKCNKELPATKEFFYSDKKGKYGLHSRCKECMKEYRVKNRDKKAKRDKEYYAKNKDKRNEYNKEWRTKNKDKIKEWRTKNKNKKNKYQRERRKTDPLFKMKTNLRSRTSTAFKSSRWGKNSSNKEMLGCSFETAKKHLERQFTKGMSWDNQGEWHIDHIIPLASATTEKELIKLCHYTNLQPLWAEDNLIKGATMLNVQIPMRV